MSLHVAYDGDMAAPDDPPSALQGPSAEAADQQQDSIAPAYATFDDRNQPVVGYDLAMKLPPICVKCGTATDTEIVLPIRVKQDVLGQILDRLEGAERHDKLRSGRFALRLPYCTSCARRQKRAISLRVARYVAPLALLLLVGLAAVIHPSLVGPALIGSLVLMPVLSIFAVRAWKDGMVDMDQVDSDGFIRLIGVHPGASEAIVAASGARPSA
jgi:hypothetical protein